MLLRRVNNSDLKLAAGTSKESVLRTRAAAVMKSPTSMVKPGRPRKKKRGEHHLIIVFNTSYRKRNKEIMNKTVKHDVTL